MSSMLGLVLADNLILLFVFWELTSVSSYLLIGFDHEREEARAAALQALLVTAGGGLALLAAFVLCASITGSFELSTLRLRAAEITGDRRYPWVAVLVLIGAFTKSAQLPFHFWLPNAMAAPTPVSAYLHAATMVKAGVYLLARLSPVLSGNALWHEVLLWTGAATMVVGGAAGLSARHFKRVLAYSTVSALGTMVFLIGIGTRAAFGALVVFLTAHALYKGALFLVAGTIGHALHESDVERLGKLRASLPRTALALALAALSMAGLPPLLGYISKELVYGAALAGERPPLTALALTANALSLAIAANVGLRPIFGGPEVGRASERQLEIALWGVPLILAGSALLLGIWPSPVSPLLSSAAASVAGGAPPLDLALWHGLNTALALSGLTVALGLVFYVSRRGLRAMLQKLSFLESLGPARGYERALAGLRRVAELETKALQGGYLRNYLLIVLVVTFVSVGYTLFWREGMPPLAVSGDVRFYELVLVGAILIATAFAVTTASRFASIISVGLVGYGVALIFIFLGAPDLGMTQLAVETLTMIVLVLSFHHLPDFARLSSPRTRLRDLVAAAAFGGLMTALVLAAAETYVVDRVSAYYGEVSLTLGHGRNVVNVILTDFRALDTLGEITVLAVAGVGVVALLSIARGRREAA
jgi:multicomponent Na+:H+ antiporter subunit A